MVTFAVTLSDLIEKGGAYAGLAAFFGLAVLAVLYFAQARELKRLREWAGRAPERAQELEQAVVARASERRPAPQVQAQPRQNPVAKPATAAASAGPPSAVASVPASDAPVADTSGDTAEVPAAADATPPTEGTPAEHEVVVKKVAAEEAAQDEAEATEDEDAVTTGAKGASAQATATTSPPVTSAPPQTGTTNGSGEIPVLPARATPSPPPRRSAPAPAPYRPDRPLPPRSPLTSHLGEDPPRRNGAVIAGVGAGIILLVVAIIAILGGGGNGGADKKTGSTQTQAVTQPGTSATPTTAGKHPTTRPTTTGPQRAATKVEVLNGTTVTGLAGSVNTRITQAGWSSAGTANFYEQTRSATVVFYATSLYRTQAQGVAKLLGVDDVQLVDANTRRLAPDANVVVVVGSDQSA